MINGLHNTTSDGEVPASFRVTWSDLDLIAKVMEQARYHVSTAAAAADDAKITVLCKGADAITTIATAVAIHQWLRETKAAIEERHAAIEAHFAALESPP